MSRFVPLLLIVLLHSSTAILDFQVFITPNRCVNLQCQFRGTGEHCDPATSLQQTLRSYRGTIFTFLNKHETDFEFFERLKRQHPLNKFEIWKDDPLGEKCEEKVLFCNSITHFLDDDANQFMKRYVSMSPERKPKFNC